MRISDWSSDVCSSDLLAFARNIREAGRRRGRRQNTGRDVVRRERRGAGSVLDEAAIHLRPAASEAQRQRVGDRAGHEPFDRSEEHTSELQSLMRISYAVFCLKKKKQKTKLN